ncbi:hypothetical protein QP166_06820 [Sphingomonas sp. LR60]|uniref:hypothetical protein n=1 Tax=Sphingomonas sp. LR60 TaxID=3050233 RepID=UPI002FE097A7
MAATSIASATRVVYMEGDVIDHGSLIAAALRPFGHDVIVDAYDFFKPGTLSSAHCASIKRKLEPRASGELIVFCPGAREYFVEGPHISVAFSGYASWRAVERLLVVPHPWGLADPGSLPVDWTEKPSLTVGFMGSTYASSRAATLCARLPRAAKEWILRGALARSLQRQAMLEERGVPLRFLPTFPRIEAIAATASATSGSDVAVDIVDTHGFDRSERSRERFSRHLLSNTYVLCPRGCENYSFRMYEALRFGRVPVVIDTDMVIPDREEIERLAVIVPYSDLNQLLDYVRRDHRAHDADAFRARQLRALAYSARLLEENWLGEQLADALWH